MLLITCLVVVALLMRLLTFLFERKLVPASESRKTTSAYEYSALVSRCISENPGLFKVVSLFTALTSVSVVALVGVALSHILSGVFLILVAYVSVGWILWMLFLLSVRMQRVNAAFSVVALVLFWPVWVVGCLSVVAGLNKSGASL